MTTLEKAIFLQLPSWGAWARSGARVNLGSQSSMAALMSYLGAPRPPRRSPPMISDDDALQIERLVNTLADWQKTRIMQAYLWNLSLREIARRRKITVYRSRVELDIAVDAMYRARFNNRQRDALDIDLQLAYAGRID